MIIAIDQSLKRIGVAVYNPGGTKLFSEISFFSIPTGLITFNQLFRKQEFIVTRMFEELKYIKNDRAFITDVVFEGYLYHSKGRVQQNFDIIELVGALKLKFIEEFPKVMFHTVNCSTWKKNIIGNGKAVKKEYTKKIQDRGYKVENDDEAAAVAILLEFINNLTNKEKK